MDICTQREEDIRFAFIGSAKLLSLVAGPDLINCNNSYDKQIYEKSNDQ